MSSNYWHPLENPNTDGENNEVSENRRSTVAVSEEMQKAVLNCYQYFCDNGKKYGAVKETVKTLKMGLGTVARIVRRGEVRISRKGYVHQRRDKFKKVDDFWKKLIQETIYNFYKNKTLF